MDDFLKEFFPSVYERKKHAHENNYCKYDNQFLQLFTSSLYLAALVASFFASATCSKLGRRPTMQLASIFFLIGVGLAAGAVNIYMLIFGRILLGFGVGFGNQVKSCDLVHFKISCKMCILVYLIWCVIGLVPVSKILVSFSLYAS